MRSDVGISGDVQYEAVTINLIVPVVMLLEPGGLLAVDHNLTSGVPAIARTSRSLSLFQCLQPRRCSNSLHLYTRGYVTQTCERRLFPSIAVLTSLYPAMLNT
jgi:hypothetical protein